jgi:hypothetical protein
MPAIAHVLIGKIRHKSKIFSWKDTKAYSIKNQKVKNKERASGVAPQRPGPALKQQARGLLQEDRSWFAIGGLATGRKLVAVEREAYGLKPCWDGSWLRVMN